MSEIGGHERGRCELLPSSNDMLSAFFGHAYSSKTIMHFVGEAVAPGVHERVGVCHCDVICNSSHDSM
jgi:hypothetical protein